MPSSGTSPGRLVLVHRTEIVFGVLEVVFFGDSVAGLGFGASQRQVMFVVSLRVLGRSGMPNRFGPDLAELASSLPHVSLLVAIWMRLCGRRIVVRCHRLCPSTALRGAAVCDPGFGDMSGAGVKAVSEHAAAARHFDFVVLC